MKVLIIYAHPNPISFTHSIFSLPVSFSTALR